MKILVREEYNEWGIHGRYASLLPESVSVPAAVRMQLDKLVKIHCSSSERFYLSDFLRDQGWSHVDFKITGTGVYSRDPGIVHISYTSRELATFDDVIKEIGGLLAIAESQTYTTSYSKSSI